MKASQSDILLTAYAGKLLNEWQQFMPRFLKPNSDLKIAKEKFREEMKTFFSGKLDRLDEYLVKNGGKKMSEELRTMILDRIEELTTKLNAPVSKK